MHVIRAHFRRLSEVSIPDILGEIGVYVIWDGKARARPSYVGEGNVLGRFVRHHENFPKPFDGFVATLSGDGITRKAAKDDAEILEVALLNVAEEVDRQPARNVSTGKRRSLTDILGCHPTIRISVSGQDPLRPPEENPGINGTKRIVIRCCGDGTADLEHEWRLRRLRT